MKKDILLLMALGFAMVSCSKNELALVEENEGTITFNTVISKSSVTPKSLVSGTAYPTAVSFGTVAYKEGATASQLYIPVSEVSYNDVDKYWSTATPYYWPKQEALTFYSYSPYSYQEGAASENVNVTATASGLEFKDYDVASHQSTDLMVAEAQVGLDVNNATIDPWKTGVKTVFHHKLAQVVAINFATSEKSTPSSYPADVKDFANGHTGEAGSEFVAGDRLYIINKVEFKGVYDKATLTSTVTATPFAQTDEWSDFKDQGDFVWHDNAAVAPFTAGKYETVCDDNGGYRLVIPQDLNGGELVVDYTIRTYTDATSYAEETITGSSVRLSVLGNWEQNKKYTYTIWFLSDRIYWTPSVVDWEDVNNGSSSI